MLLSPWRTTAAARCDGVHELDARRARAVSAPLQRHAQAAAQPVGRPPQAEPLAVAVGGGGGAADLDEAVDDALEDDPGPAQCVRA